MLQHKAREINREKTGLEGMNGTKRGRRAELIPAAETRSATGPVTVTWPGALASGGWLPKAA